MVGAERRRARRRSRASGAAGAPRATAPPRTRPCARVRVEVVTAATASTAPSATDACSPSQSIQRSRFARSGDGSRMLGSRRPGHRQQLAGVARDRQRPAREQDPLDHLRLVDRAPQRDEPARPPRRRAARATPASADRVERPDARPDVHRRPLPAPLELGQHDRQRARLVGAARAAAGEHERDPLARHQAAAARSSRAQRARRSAAGPPGPWRARGGSRPRRPPARPRAAAPARAGARTSRRTRRGRRTAARPRRPPTARSRARRRRPAGRPARRAAARAPSTPSVPTCWPGPREHARAVLLDDPEVGEVRPAVRGEEDVRRLDVAVDDPAGVQRLQPVRDVAAQPHERVERERAEREPVAQRAARQHRLDEVRPPVVLAAGEHGTRCGSAIPCTARTSRAKRRRRRGRRRGRPARA